MGGDIGVAATCRRGSKWSTERCFVPYSGGTLRLSLGSLETVTLTAVRPLRHTKAGTVREGDLPRVAPTFA